MTEGTSRVELAETMTEGTSRVELAEKPEVSHGKPVLVWPGVHFGLSNIDEKGLFIEDEVFMLKGRPQVRKAKTSPGNIMAAWRKLRDEGDEEMKDLFNEIAVWQQPSAFLDGCALEWVRNEIPVMQQPRATKR